MAKKYEISLSNLWKVNWKQLLKSKTFWLGVVSVAIGVHSGQYEIVLAGLGVITVRDALTK